MAYRRGEVVLVPFPFTNLQSTKVRPAVVMSTAKYEQATGNMVVAMLTSKTQPGPYDYQLLDWQQANLVKPTWARSKVATLDPGMVLHTVGKLSVRDLQGVEQIVKLAVGL